MSNSTSSQTVSRVGSSLTIDGQRCPTCNEDRFIFFRGNRVPCPTCCSTIRRGELYVAAESPGPLQTRRSVLIVVAITGVLALLLLRLLTLH